MGLAICFRLRVAKFQVADAFDYNLITILEPRTLIFKKVVRLVCFKTIAFLCFFFMWKPNRTEPVNLYNGNMPPCHKPIAICFIIKFHPKFDVVLNRMRMCQPCGDHCQH
jgi:hypothetical protein